MVQLKQKPQEAAYCAEIATCSHFLTIRQCWSLWRLDLQTLQFLEPGVGGSVSRSVAPIVGFLIGSLGDTLGSLFSRFSIWPLNTGSFLVDTCLLTKVAIYWFDKDNATSNDDVMKRRVVWIQLPVPVLTLSGQGRVSFTTAIPLFPRCSHNVWIFVLFSSWKGKKIILICKVIFYDMIFVSSNGKAILLSYFDTTLNL